MFVRKHFHPQLKHEPEFYDLKIRLATRQDISTLEPIIESAIEQLQKGFLNAEQIKSSHAIMGIDTQLIDDGTYYVVELDDIIAGCGGWSRRATLYGGDHSGKRSAELLNPITQAARVRAMYTQPNFVRRGVGRCILTACESAARVEGFLAVELMATMSGVPLYQVTGYQAIEAIEDAAGGAAVPLLRMRKSLLID